MTPRRCWDVLEVLLENMAQEHHDERVQEHDRLRRERPELFVVDCHCQPKTNGLRLGRVQREVLAFLGTHPGGFGSTSWSPDELTKCADHSCTPNLVSLRSVEKHVYATETPTPAQVRAVQRAVRRLEAVGLVVCQHGWLADQKRTYRTRLGFDGYLPVSGLFVGLVDWECEHELSHSVTCRHTNRGSYAVEEIEQGSSHH